MDTNALFLLSQAVVAPELQDYRLSLPEIALLFFIMLGPLKVFGPFAAATRELAPTALRSLAIKTFVLSVIAVVLGGLLGSALLTKWHISAPVLQLAAGLIFSLVALQMVMEQYHEPAPAHADAANPLRMVFPVNVTPYGLAAVILLLAMAHDQARVLLVLCVALVMLALNLLAMMTARKILHWAGLPLQILGAVLGILQLALGLKIVISALAGIGVDIFPA